MTDTSSSSSSGNECTGLSVSPINGTPKILLTCDVPEKTNRCTELFKNLKLETLKFDNKRSDSPEAKPDMSVRPKDNKKSKKKKQTDNEMQLQKYSQTDAHYRRLPITAMQSLMLAIYNSVKKNTDNNSKHLIKHICDQFEMMRTKNPLDEDPTLKNMHRKYTAIFNQMIMTFQKSDSVDGQKVLGNDLVPKNKVASNDFMSSLSELLKNMPKSMSATSFIQPSRYCSEFEEMDLLGEGGYGKVYKAQNKVDNMTYAVKKIKLRNPHPSNLASVQREVQVMAKLKHSNIVAYSSSWWEAGGSSDSSDSQDDSISTYTSTTTTENHRSTNSRKCKGVPVTLYVQMELCKNTLESYLRERNDMLQYFKDQDPLNVVDAEFSLEIFQQILVAVNYIHSECTMHRDLKPSNVFVDKEKRLVKIGDFGLARIEWMGSITELNDEGPYTPLVGQKFTAKLGTQSYAAPEQLNSSNYDKKADMYSLGFIDFELFYPFGTKMERAITMQSLRKCEGNIPELDKIKERWPLQANIILKLLCHDPRLRLSSSEALEMCPRLSEKDLIVELLEQLRKKDELITKMSKHIKNQDSHVRQVEKRKKKLSKRLNTLLRQRRTHNSGDSSLSDR